MPDRDESPTQGPSPKGGPTRIFLSYARGDDEAFVARLNADLNARGFDVWWERKMTKSECRMSKEGRKPKTEHRAPKVPLQTLGFGLPSSFGIRHSTFARTTTCDYVIAEWQHAVTCGKAINPVLRLGDFPLVPDAMKLLTSKTFARMWGRHPCLPVTAASSSQFHQQRLVKPITLSSKTSPGNSPNPSLSQVTCGP